MLKDITNLKCWCGGRVGPRDPGTGDSDGLGCLDSIYHVWSATGEPGQISKLYVAGPMTGYRDNNYPEFNRVSDLLRGAGYEVVNPASFGEGAHYVDFLREDLRMLLTCQAVATLDHWWESAGARNEVQVAGILKMPVRSPAEWIQRVPLELYPIR